MNLSARAEARTGGAIPAGLRVCVSVCLAVVLAGCANPINVQVIDSANGRPVAGAEVARMAVRMPYFIIGAIRPVEERVTDSNGIARMKDRGGWFLRVTAVGYDSTVGNLDTRADTVTVELESADAAARRRARRHRPADEPIAPPPAGPGDDRTTGHDRVTPEEVR